MPADPAGHLPVTTYVTMLYDACMEYRDARERMNDLLAVHGAKCVQAAADALGGLRPLARLTGISHSYLHRVVSEQVLASPHIVILACVCTGIHRRPL